MPGINRTGLPQTSDLVLGRGALYFAALDATTKRPLGLRHLGNCTGFTLTVDSETLEHMSSRSGVRSVDRELVLSQKVSVGITLDELNFQNLALHLSGTASKDQTNPARTTVTQLQLQAAAYKGFSYQATNSSGAALFDLDGTLVVKSGGANYGAASLLYAGTDYVVDTKWGTIFIPSTSTHVDGAKLWIDYTTAGTERVFDKVDMLTQETISGFLRYVMINAANSDKQMVFDLHSVNLKADGDLSLIGDEFASMTLKGSAERNEVGFPTSPVGRIYYHADA